MEDLLVLMNDRLGVCNMFFQFFQERWSWAGKFPAHRSVCFDLSGCPDRKRQRTWADFSRFAIIMTPYGGINFCLGFFFLHGIRKLPDQQYAGMLLQHLM